jgi:ferritin-like metal-binding protein YciE
VYRALLLEAQAHERIVAARLEDFGGQPSGLDADATEAAQIALATVGHPVPDTPIRLAETAYALESHEVAAYRLLLSLAERAGDAETAALAARILEQEKTAAARIAATFPRAVDAALRA